MLESSKKCLLLTENKTLFCKTMPPGSRPEHFHFTVPRDITLTVKHPIDIKVVLDTGGTVALPLGNDFYSTQNQSAIDASLDPVVILTKDSITSLTLPKSSKVSFTQTSTETKISCHFENTTSEEPVRMNLSLLINTYEYLTCVLPEILSKLKVNRIAEIGKIVLDDDDIIYLLFYIDNKELIDSFDERNKRLDREIIDPFIQEHWSELYPEHVDEPTLTPLLGILEVPAG